MKIKINNEALAHALGYRLHEVVTVEDVNGIPKNREWRNRLKDSEYDNCVIVIKDKKEVKK